MKKEKVRGIAQGLAFGLGLGLILTRIVLRETRRMNFTGKSVVISGGSRGLGLILARHFAAEGAMLTLLARNLNELERARLDLQQQYGGRVLTVACDISQQDEVNAAIQRVMEEYGRIDVLVNDAGIIQVGPVEHMQVEDYQAAMGVHFWGPLYSMLAVIPLMRAQGGGRIVNVASIGGQVAVPHLAPYVASKFALVGLSDAFRAELAKDSIDVSTVCPGLMRTGSPPNALFKGQNQKEYAWFSAMDSLPMFSMNAEKAAREIVDVARFGVSKRTLTFQARTMALVEEIAPNLVAEAMKLAVRVMPGPSERQGDQARIGHESRPEKMPGWLTANSDRAGERNNEARVYTRPTD